MQIATPNFNKFAQKHRFALSVFIALFGFVFFAGGLVVANGQTLGPNDSKIVNLYVDGEERTIPTRAQTVKEFLNNAGVIIGADDFVEPVVNTQILDDNFIVNVYRAKPVIIIDGQTERRIMTPYSTPKQVAEKAGYATYPEDKLSFVAANSFVQEQIIGQKLIIDRASAITLSLYGSPAVIYRTHAETVGELLNEKGIVVEQGATITPVESIKLTPNMAIFITKFGKQIVTKDEDFAFPVETTLDPTQPFGKITIVNAGKKGKKQIVYEVTLSGGRESSRTKIQEVITLEPVKQVQTKGSKPGSGLSRSKGANMFMDSKGVVHRETYYDLPMSGVMRSCGAGGYYTVRADGGKVDKDGYVIIAANLNIYPRCSIVETSMGSAKVYDTGGFALRHPYGFDLATDWSNNDGR